MQSDPTSAVEAKVSEPTPPAKFVVIYGLQVPGHSRLFYNGSSLAFIALQQPQHPGSRIITIPGDPP